MTIPIYLPEPDGKFLTVLAEVCKHEGVEAEFADLRQYGGEACIPGLMFGKPLPEHTEALEHVKSMGRPILHGPSAAEVFHSPAGLERLRRAVRLWRMYVDDACTDPIYVYDLIDSENPVGLGNLVQMTPGHTYLVVDIETSGDIKEDEPQDTYLLSVSVLWPPHTSHSDPVIQVWNLAALADPACLQALADILLSAPFLLHNGQFDVKWLNALLKPYLHGKKVYPEEDTFLCHYTMYPGAQGDHGLKELAQKLLGAPEWEADIHRYLKGSKAHYERIPQNLLCAYNAGDVYWTWHLFILLDSWLDERPPQVRQRYRDTMANSRMLVDIEDADAGWPVDLETLHTLRDKLTPKVNASLAKFRMAVGDPTPYLSATSAAQRRRYLDAHKPLTALHEFNPGSWQQVLRYLQAHGVDAPDTQEDTLTELLKEGVPPKAAKFIRRLFAYRHAKKMLGTYVEGPLRRQRNGRVYPRFNLAGTVTGRLASWIHTIPRPAPNELEFRAPYTVDPGEVLIGADYGQIETRCVAELSGDEQMIDDLQLDRPDFFSVLMPGAYPNIFPRGMKDVWQLKEREPVRFGELRNSIKSFSHGLNYGRQPAAIAAQFELPIKEAYRITNSYLGRYPKLVVWQEQVMDFVEGQRIDPTWGVPGLWTPSGRRFQQGVIQTEKEWTIRNAALAFGPQASGNDICLDAALELHTNYLHLYDARIVNTQHDALYVIAPEDKAETVKKVMERVMSEAALKTFQRVPFPVKAKVGKRWSEVS